MKKLCTCAAMLVFGASSVGFAASNQMEGGKMASKSAMSSKMNVVENASQSPNHTTLVAAVKAAGLVDTLSGPGPFTVFAPTNAAFEKLPAGTVDSLLKPENKDKLTKILTYHVVSGKMDAAKLKKAIKDGNGTAILKTVEGEDLTATMEDGTIGVKDAKGDVAKVTKANIMSSNGIIHVIDTVLQP